MHAQKLRDSQLNPLHCVKNEKNGEKLQKKQIQYWRNGNGQGSGKSVVRKEVYGAQN